VRYRPVASQKFADLWRTFVMLNQNRTPGMWDPQAMDFPSGDPDRAFMEFVTKHADQLIDELEKIVCVLPLSGSSTERRNLPT
jgi:hypothetical protein